MSALFPPIACIKAVKTSPLYPIYYKNYSAVAPSTPLTPQKHQQVLPLLLMNNLPLKYECSWHGCDQIFSSEDESYAHLVETHSLIGKQVCKWDKHGGGICNTHLRHRSQLIEHIITHFSLAVRPYPCKEEVS